MRLHVAEQPLVGCPVPGALGPQYDSSFSTPDSESTRGFALLEEQFPGFGSQFSGQIVFETDAGVDDPEVVAAMTEMFAEVDEIEGVTVVSPYTPFGAQQVSGPAERIDRLEERNETNSGDARMEIDKSRVAGEDRSREHIILGGLTCLNHAK